jgi:hypothetical protein
MLQKTENCILGSRIFIATGGWVQSADGSVTCETSPESVILGKIEGGTTVKKEGEMTKSMRTLIVHAHTQSTMAIKQVLRK